jgi:urease accessory protein
MGFVLATGCLHGVGIAIGSVHRWNWGKVAVRVAGAVIALIGVVFFWKALS